MSTVEYSNVLFYTPEKATGTTGCQSAVPVPWGGCPLTQFMHPVRPLSGPHPLVAPNLEPAEQED